MKSKAARITLAGLFLMLIYVPGLLWLIAGKQLATPNNENRELAQWPAFSLAEIEKLPTRYENYYRDHLPFRNQLISAYAQGLKAVFDDSVVTTVTFGKDDWYFYNNINDGDPISSYRGEDLFTGAELREIVLNLRRTRDNLKKQGIEFVLFIAPNKERVYPEYMPDRFGQPAEDYAAKQLVEFLRAHSDIRVVYACDDILALKDALPDTPVYCRTDTHWNGLGSYAAARALMAELGFALPPLAMENVTRSASAHKGDLTILAHLDTVDPGEDAFLVTDGQRPQYTVQSDPRLMWHIGQGDPDGKKLFIKTDSFSESMLPYILPWFSQSQVYFNELYEETMVDDFEPDVFVQVCVERYVRKWLTRGPLYTLPQDR